MVTVLLVDDDPGICEFVAMVVEEAGYAAVCASDGVEAMERIAATAVDVVVSDVVMPRLGGMQMLVRLRAAGNYLPVVLMSANGLPAAIAGVTFLPKPLDLNDLLGAIAAAVPGGDRPSD
jgi:two-component system cell cycle sensor histidine kinase/response regulator CckA